MTDRRYTTAYAASRALHELLEVRLTDQQPGVTAAWGWPGVDAADEFVWVGEVESADQETAEIGRGARDEAYTIFVYVDVASRTHDMVAIGARVGELVREVEDVVHDNPSLSDALRADGWAQVAGVETIVPTRPATESAWLHVARISVACAARI